MYKSGPHMATAVWYTGVPEAMSLQQAATVSGETAYMLPLFPVQQCSLLFS